MRTISVLHPETGLVIRLPPLETGGQIVSGQRNFCLLFSQKVLGFTLPIESLSEQEGSTSRP